MTFYDYPDNDTELAYEVDYRIIGAYVRGKYCLSNGDAGYEDEYPELEILSIELDGRDVTGEIGRELSDRIQDACWKDWKQLNN